MTRSDVHQFIVLFFRRTDSFQVEKYRNTSSPSSVAKNKQWVMSYMSRGVRKLSKI